ncbi:MAG: PDZ domain-containing protein [Armatimonadetes bacterium]|nr:PDZ domain-containing protein [Armatimonadota bacterium]
MSEGTITGFRARVAMLALALLFGMALGALVIARTGIAAGAQGSQKTVDVPAAKVAGLASLESGFTAIAEQVQPAIVSIEVKKAVKAPQRMELPQGFDFFGPDDMQAPDPGSRRTMPPVLRQQGSGSGLVVRSDGWILTNDHVVGGADKVTVRLSDGREFEGAVRRDFRSDLALVKISAAGLPALEFADSDKVKVGQWAVAFGAPFTLDDTMTVGIISARGRQKAISEGLEGRFYPSLLQTDAAINPGNSGGPLVDIRGRVIGVNTAINSPTGGSVGIGFAIPANTAKGIMEQLITKGKVTRGFLGLVPRALTPRERSSYKVPGAAGAIIEGVSEGTPASEAGIAPGDVVLQYDGHEVRDDVDLRQMVASTPPGAKVSITLFRDGKQQKVTATLKTPPDVTADAQDNTPEPGTGGKIGIRAEPVSAGSRQQYKIAPGVTGLVVLEVQPGGPADEAGIQVGDVIVKAGGRELKADADLKAALSGAKKGDSVAMVIARDKSRTLVSVTLP